MKRLTEYIKENLDIDNFEYKFDVWFKSDKDHYEPILKLLQDCYERRILTKEDVDKFIGQNPKFQIKKFVDFFDENVKKDDSINID